MNSQFITYDKDADEFYAWEAEFGSWDHRILTRAQTLPEVQMEYPFALVGTKAQLAWDHKTQQQKAST